MQDSEYIRGFEDGKAASIKIFMMVLDTFCGGRAVFTQAFVEEYEKYEPHGGVEIFVDHSTLTLNVQSVHKLKRVPHPAPPHPPRLELPTFAIESGDK